MYTKEQTRAVAERIEQYEDCIRTGKNKLKECDWCDKFREPDRGVCGRCPASADALCSGAEIRAAIVHRVAVKTNAKERINYFFSKMDDTEIIQVLDYWIVKHCKSL